MKRLFSLAFILILCLHTLSIIASQPNAGGGVDSGITRVEKAVNFLMSQFNPQMNLCREVPNVALNTYWLVSDNLWAYKALEMMDITNTSSLIKGRLIELAQIYNLPTDAQGFPISYAHEAVIGDTVSVPFNASTNCTLYRNAYILNTTMLNGTIMSDWQEYTDLLLYAALSCHWQENDTAANQYFELAKNMWDGTGINDTATMTERLYATYKLALLLYTSKVLGKSLPFEFELVSRIWSLQRESDGGIITNYFANGTALGNANTETTSIVIIAILRARPKVFAFYYPWYGTPESWDNITHHPLDFYDSNNTTLIKEHIGMAKEAGIDGFVVSWWGINHPTDSVTSHIKNICEEDIFKFTVYYEETSSVDQTVNDTVYILNNYANSNAWYKIDDRPVIYIYCRARDNLNPQAWKLYGYYINESEPAQRCWMLSEEVRKPPRYGIFQIHPDNETGIGYIESANPIFLPPNETYSLKAGISDIRNDCAPNSSDVGFRVKIRNETEDEDWKNLTELIVNFNDGWLDLSFDISDYAGQNVSIRVESFAGGVESWCSEWAAVDYFYIENSTGKIVSPEPFFDNGWKAVVDELRKKGFHPYLIIDFTGYEKKIQDFAEYFLNFTDGLHIYGPCGFSASLSKVFEVYNQASDAAHSKNKIFLATVMPGYNDTNCPGRRGYVVDRQNGTYYTSFWSIATACFPDGYVITSFNEWYEGTEIEPSREYGYQYINLTRSRPTVWTVNDDEPADFSMIQEAINTASPGDIVYVRNGTYYENIVANKTILLIGESRDATVVDGGGLGTLIVVSSNNTIIKRFTIRNSADKQNGGWSCGIWLSNASDCALLSNYITNNTFGIMLYSSSSNLLKDNDVVNNLHGICLFFSSNNKFYHNDFIDNTRQVCSFTSENLWDDGYPSGGNYWSDYEERYPNATEIDDLGIWDTPYSIDENNQDNYPLIPEFPLAIILPLFMVLTVVAVLFAKRRFPRKSDA